MRLLAAKLAIGLSLRGVCLSGGSTFSVCLFENLTLCRFNKHLSAPWGNSKPGRLRSLLDEGLLFLGNRSAKVRVHQLTWVFAWSFHSTSVVQLRLSSTVILRPKD